VCVGGKEPALFDVSYTESKRNKMDNVVHMDSHAATRSVVGGRVWLAVDRIVCTLEQSVPDLSVE
jgi:hypothetical protein